MSDRHDPRESGPAPGPSNVHEFTVSELSDRLKRVVEGEFGHVRVRAEISGLKRAASGHVYLSLKDDRAVIDGVIWRGSVSRLGCKPEDGLEVVCTGRLTTYPARSRYQIVIEQMEPAGVGALMALLEERRRKLAAEGLFDEARKRPLPYLPAVIGVVTSPSGAVIRDILHRLRDRFPRHVLVWPVLVQGEGAAAQVAAAIRGFNALTPGGKVPRPDLLIVARGGGSLEDLWAFNEEDVVRAAAESEIPLISAVGHETDTTLIDFASDRRAPTPTAAAEIAVPVRTELAAGVMDLERRGFTAARRLLNERQTRLTGLARALRDPRSVIEGHIQRLDDLAEGLRRSLTIGVERRRAGLNGVSAKLRPGQLRELHRDGKRRADDAHQRLKRDWDLRLRQHNDRLDGLNRLLQTLSYKNTLDRGFAVVRGAGGSPITDAAQTEPGLGIDIEFRDGHAAATVDGGGAAKPAKPKRQSGKAPKSQGSLF
ncbi:MAG: exodeoxyribonuclease VII large subunit [Minwuiales bacterium]|nr:exodeoxyribonuclease VII large subunit [Minwuiales bacterium]